MKNLITGGAGFIGSNLCRALLEKDQEVICVDDFSSGRMKNIEELKNYENFQIMEKNVINSFKVNQKIDRVFHLASRASPKDYQNHPLQTIRTNTDGTLNMLRLADRNNAKFLFSSTSEVYGDPEVHPQEESYNGNVDPTGPRACYDEAKRLGETLVMNYSEQNEVDAKIVRIFNTYGPHMKPEDGRVITNFLRQAIKNEPLTVYGEGTQTRSFCYIDDMVRGLQRVMENGELGPYNLGNPDEITIKELAKTIQDNFDTNSEITHQELPEDDPQRRKPDINRVKKIGWSPEISLEKGLEKTAEYLKKDMN